VAAAAYNIRSTDFADLDQVAPYTLRTPCELPGSEFRV
jgi:hypothetical protein